MAKIPTAQAFLYSAPAGVPGDITRVDESNVEPAMLIAAGGTYAQAFGIPLKYVAGGVQQFSGSEAATDFAAVLVREVPQISGNNNQGLDDTTPNPEQPNGICVRGYISVKCMVGTPVRGGVVYVRITASGPKNIGDFEASSDTSLSVALTSTQASWASDGKDANNNAELRVAR